MYELSDRIMRRINRRNLRLFDPLRLMPFDELNILRTVSDVYEESYKRVKRDYLKIALGAYTDALIAASVRKDNAEVRAKREIDEDWILDMLEEYDEITLYRFIPEKDRKKMRLAEALIASHGTVNRPKGAASAPKEVDKALRLWTCQIAQYALNVTDKATLQGYKDGGVKYVRWNTQEDERVCPYCRKLDKKVFRIDKAPKKQHYRCRCYLTPAEKPSELVQLLQKA